MTIEEALFQFLTTCPPIRDLVAKRVYPVIAPQEPIAPLLLYQRISGTRERAASGPAGVEEGIYNLTALAKTYAEAKALARIVRDELDMAAGYWGDVKVGSIAAELNRDDYSGDLKLFGALVVSSIQYTEA